MCERKKVGNGVRPPLIELRLECSCSICAYVREREIKGVEILQYFVATFTHIHSMYTVSIKNFML